LNPPVKPLSIERATPPMLLQQKVLKPLSMQPRSDS